MSSADQVRIANILNTEPNNETQETRNSYNCPSIAENSIEVTSHDSTLPSHTILQVPTSAQQADISMPHNNVTAQPPQIIQGRDPHDISPGNIPSMTASSTLKDETTDQQQ